jgi:hypothetical protein
MSRKDGEREGRTKERIREGKKKYIQRERERKTRPICLHVRVGEGWLSKQPERRRRRSRGGAVLLPPAPLLFSLSYDQT